MYSLEIYVGIYFFFIAKSLGSSRANGSSRARANGSSRAWNFTGGRDLRASFGLKVKKAFDGNFCALPLSPTIKALL